MARGDVSGVDDAEVEYLAKTVKTNGIVTELDLRGNQIRGPGLQALIIAATSEQRQARACALAHAGRVGCCPSR